MRIIEPGKESFVVVCPVCGCKFEYTVGDLEFPVVGHPRVHCPECQQSIEHATNDANVYPWNQSRRPSVLPPIVAVYAAPALVPTDPWYTESSQTSSLEVHSS